MHVGALFFVQFFKKPAISRNAKARHDESWQAFFFLLQKY